MTDLLRHAFEEVSKMDQLRQDEVAKWVLDEISSERQWESAFEGSQDVLEKLAEEARAEIRSGHTRRLDPDSL